MVARGFYGELDNYEKNKIFVSKFEKNDRENVVIEFVLINFKHTEAIKFYITNKHFVVIIQKQTICLTSTCMIYLNKDLFLACFVYLILSQKILDLTSNIKNLIFFFNKWQCYVAFKKRHYYYFIYSKYH